LKPQTFLIALSSKHAMICLALNFLLISSSKKHRVTHEFGAGFVCFVFVFIGGQGLIHFLLLKVSLLRMYAE